MEFCHVLSHCKVLPQVHQDARDPNRLPHFSDLSGVLRLGEPHDQVRFPAGELALLLSAKLFKLGLFQALELLRYPIQA